jgi:hypothetical protein
MAGTFPAQPGVQMEDEWPVGDETTWKEALKALDIDPEDTQAVATTVVRHVTTTWFRPRRATHLPSAPLAEQGSTIL